MWAGLARLSDAMGFLTEKLSNPEISGNRFAVKYRGMAYCPEPAKRTNYRFRCICIAGSNFTKPNRLIFSNHDSFLCWIKILQ